MQKIKIYIITLCLILSTLLVNISGVYAGDGNDTQDTSNEINMESYTYNVFNANIIPFYVDLDTGIGWYYTGYMPEIAYEKGGLDDYTNNYELGSWDHFHKALEDSRNEELYFYIQFNGMKTFWYYYDGEKLEFYTDLTNGVEYRKDLPEFLEGMSTSVGGNDIIINNLDYENYALTNFALIEDDYWRATEMGTSIKGLLSYGVYLPWIQNFNLSQDGHNDEQAYTLQGLFLSYFYNDNGTIKNNPSFYYDLEKQQQIYSNKYMAYASWLNGHNNYENNSLNINSTYMSFVDIDKDGKYTINDQILYKYKGTTGNSLLTAHEDVDLYFYIDYKITIGSVWKYERKYFKLDDLVNSGWASAPDGNLVYLSYQYLFESCSFYDGDEDDITIKGIGSFWVESMSDLSLPFYLQLTYCNNISNQCYMAWIYDDEGYNHFVPAYYKGYSLKTDYSSWELFYNNEIPKSEEGTIILDGINPDHYISDENKNNVVEVDQLVSNFFNSIRVLLGNLTSYTSKLAEIFSAFFSLIPERIKALIEISIFMSALVGLYKIFKPGGSE